MRTEAGVAHAERCRAILAAIGPDRGRPLGLAKKTSNLFRDRRETPKQRLHLSAFCHVLAIDTIEGWVDVEGSTTYEDLVAATLPLGCMPAVVPQLKTITVGGAVAGVGIEATSFRHGLVHDTMLELEVLLPTAEIVLCTPTNAHRDLFEGFPNSYGTLGYALRVRLRTRPVGKFVQVRHQHLLDDAAFFERLAAACNDDGNDFVDGVVFGAAKMVLSCATFVDAAPWTSDYGFESIYYRSLVSGEVDYLRTEDYLWRWDTDWFWCSRNFGAQQPWLRRLYGRARLNSRTWTRLMRWNARWGVTRRWARLRGRHTESVIQDVDIPLARAPEFLAFLRREIAIAPIWICPLRAPARPTAALYPLDAGALYVNFGFWDAIESRTPEPRGYRNRLIEREAERLGGIKSLYSESYFGRDEFDAAYGMAAYAGLKKRYDPQLRLPGLYEKCVLGA